jgi:hypothetical protein
VRAARTTRPAPRHPCTDLPPHAALGGNLGGLTSWLLGLDGGHTASSLRVDRIVPVLGFKRCYDAAYGYEFVYPADWLADQTLLFRAAQRAEAARALDPPPLRRAPKPREVTEPSAAFGPAGSTCVARAPGAGAAQRRACGARAGLCRPSPAPALRACCCCQG